MFRTVCPRTSPAPFPTTHSSYLLTPLLENLLPGLVANASLNMYDQNNEPDDDDDDDDNDDDGREDNFPYPTSPDLVEVTSQLTHDLFTGHFSKWIFKRKETAENLSRTFLAEDEISFYIFHYMRPKLLSILSGSTARFFIWAGMENSFQQIFDETETVSRWTSLRNRSTFCPSFASEEETIEFVTRFLRNFANEVLGDIFEMETIFRKNAAKRNLIVSSFYQIINRSVRFSVRHARVPTAYPNLIILKLLADMAAAMEFRDVDPNPTTATVSDMLYMVAAAGFGSTSLNHIAATMLHEKKSQYINFRLAARKRPQSSLSSGWIFSHIV